MTFSFRQAIISSAAPSVDTAIQSTPRTWSHGLLWRMRGIVRTLRPHQWVKNLFVLAPVVFAKNVSVKPLVIDALAGFVIFCLLASAVYTMNDLADAAADRAHPIKRTRPIASGQVSESTARGMVFALVFAAFFSAGITSLWLLASVAAYFVLNVAYSFVLKKWPYVDVVCIACGFVLRVLAGGFATSTRVSGYMLACTALLALFLGFGKRRHEMNLAGGSKAKQRPALEGYSPRTLDIAIAMTGLASVTTYLAYALDPTTQSFLGSPWAWLTSIHPLFGILRFSKLIASGPGTDSPTEEMLRDIPFVTNLVVWTLEIVFLLYLHSPL